MNCVIGCINCAAFPKLFVTFEIRKTTILKPLIIVLLFCCSLPDLQAQQYNYMYDEITVKEGLAQVTINFVQQDTRGYMWLGGNSVVQRYDGHRFQNFYIGKNRKIPGSNLQGMHFDSAKNRLWLLTGNNHLGYLDADKLTYHAVNIITPAGFENTWFALQVNKAGELILIYVDKGITTYNEQANEVAARYNAFNFPAGWEPRHIWQENGCYWIGTKNGLLKYNSKNKLLSYRNHNQENDPVIGRFADRAVSTVVYTYGNLVWLFFNAGKGQEIYSYNSYTGDLKEWHPVIKKNMQGRYHTIHGVIEFNDGTTWMTGDEIFAQVNYQQHDLSVIKPEASGANSIRYDDVYNLYQDREKSNWVCTNKGLFRFNPSAHLFKTIKNAAVNDPKNYNTAVNAFLETTDGEILAATWGTGVFCYDNHYKPIQSKYVSRNKPADKDMTWSLLQTRNGDIWQGCQDGKLGVCHAATKKTTWLYPEPLKRYTIRQLAEDKNGTVWLGTAGGQLARWDAVTNQFKLVHQLRRQVSKLYVDTKNDLWVCTDNDGVYCINTTDGKIINTYTENGVPGKTMLSNGASDIVQFDDTTMVMSSNGLSILNTKTGYFTYLDEGTPIASMVIDKKKNLWFTFNTGIACRMLYNKDLIYTFNAGDGISNTEFQANAAIRLRNGDIAFGTSHDIMIFDPERSVNFTLGKPFVHVSEIFLGDKRLSVDSVLRLKSLTLPYVQNSLRFHFTINQFQTLQNIHYLVEGLDKTWKKIPAGGELSLNYLPPGKYIIKTTCLDESLEPGNITSITVIVSAPFYQTWWFYSLLILVISALLLWLDRERTKRKEALMEMRSNIADNLHQEVNTVLNNINILSEMALMKSAQDPKKSAEFVQQIQRKSRHMITSMDDMLWAIDPENDSMQKTVERLREYADAASNQNQAAMQMLVDGDVKQLKLDMHLRHEVFFLCKETINALIQSGVTNCRIHILLEKNTLLFTFEFNNRDTQVLNDILQRPSVEQRLAAINAVLKTDVLSKITALELRVPIR